ncbi:MAG: UDP-N-acetylmuramoyl-L-alanine--D-glutamate ligase [Antricoccus sp.]
MTSYRNRKIIVAGGGASGASAALVLAGLGASVAIADARALVFSADLAAAHVRYAGDLTAAPSDTDLIVTSPGWRPDNPLLVDAARKSIPVIGEVELAWALRDPGVPWLAVTGTNGKTTTVGMLTQILRAAGLQVAEVGNVGPPIVRAATDRTTGFEAFSVELSSFQLHWAPSVQPAVGAILNLATDHLDWHGSVQAYGGDKARIFGGPINVYNAQDPAVVDLARKFATGKAVAFTTSSPDSGQVGIRDGLIVDRAYSDGQPLVRLEALQVVGVHNHANAAAAAAVALGDARVTPNAVRDGLLAYQPGAHRNCLVAQLSVRPGSRIDFVDDSKATNAHAAAASLSAYQQIVWIAGGLMKGATVQDIAPLIRNSRDRLAGVVLMGVDQAVISEALRRHAPNVPTERLSSDDDRGMPRAVALAHRLAAAALDSAPGVVTVLLAPAAASMDMFIDYADRGDKFIDAARVVATAR